MSPIYKIPGAPRVNIVWRPTLPLVHIADSNRAVGLWVSLDDLDELIANLQAARDELTGREEA